MADQMRCGKGLAENAVLPRAMGRVAFALAGVLECHIKALDVTDPAGRQEYDAYRRLIDDFRGVAPHLRTVAEQMAGYRELPLTRHDPEAMASADAREALRGLVEVEQEMLAVLQKQVDEFRGILESFRDQ